MRTPRPAVFEPTQMYSIKEIARAMKVSIPIARVKLRSLAIPVTKMSERSIRWQGHHLNTQLLG